MRVHQHLRDHGGDAAADAFPAEHLAGDALDHVAHAALRIGDAGIERQARHAPLAFFHADQDVADLRAVAVGDHDAALAAEQRYQVVQRFRGVGELLGNRAGLAGPRDGVAAQSDHQSLRHTRSASYSISPSAMVSAMIALAVCRRFSASA